ncbi:GntR family transcriptional regulator [Ancylobacter pratisalsi]|uniref:GntR family transcriptional regulator n=1 Tax=Ancylobacter pratisalsi TaxID=1745854 RepID=A0A6P1YQ72_9HYPH|nr:GntR family transcriptional regulator [Ancylobacter pratisalsi]QIB34293.1 GntR family transcriptional regulator [Ancylobacter pratisalsi]
MTPILQHRTLSAAILDQLRKAILDGTYPAGTQLRQDALAATFKVSRIPIREALFQLDAEGLVRFVPQKGAIVSELSADEINDVFELRCLLEPRLLARSIPNLGRDDFTQFGTFHTQMVAATATQDLSRWGQLNADFHMALYGHAGQPRTLSIVHSLLQSSDRYTRVQLSDATGSGMDGMQRAMSEHTELIDLCRSGAIEKACAFLRQHIASVHEDLLRAIERGSREETP